MTHGRAANASAGPGSAEMEAAAAGVESGVTGACTAASVAAATAALEEPESLTPLGTGVADSARRLGRHAV